MATCRSALTAGVAVAPAIQVRLANQWQRAQNGLAAVIDHRKAERLASLTSKLAAREQAERKSITMNTERFEATLKKALAKYETEEDALFSVVEGRGDEREIAQWRRDRENREKRLRELGWPDSSERAVVRKTSPRPSASRSVRRWSC
jgi:hypothetical protein